MITSPLPSGSTCNTSVCTSMLEEPTDVTTPRSRKSCTCEEDGRRGEHLHACNGSADGERHHTAHRRQALEDGEAVVGGGDDGDRVVADPGVPQGAVGGEGVELLEEAACSQ
jgi:hypothetical protein